MTRALTDHVVNPANDTIEVLVLDEPGVGGAHHDYLIDIHCGELDGKDAYEAYAASTDWKSAISGAPLPKWEDQLPAVQQAWVAAAEAPRRSPRLLFQNGPIAERGVGVNGITHEALLAIIADRLRHFQAGPFSCRENAIALTKIEEALHWLAARTRARMARGVEGTHAR